MSTATLTIEYLDKFLEHVGPQYDWREPQRFDFDYGRTAMGGEYDLGFLVRDHKLRDAMRREYAYAIPTQEALEEIAAHGPVVEIGAGSGYWAMLLSQLTDVVAYDTGAWRFTKKWFEVNRGGPKKVRDHHDRTLFLCWPPYNTPMAVKTLKLYRGDIVAFVGEGNGGCTAGDDFFEQLEREWSEVQTVWIPQWNHIHDYLSIWKRR
jgi:hypothetical protein